MGLAAWGNRLRDPKRIDTILSQIKVYWKNHPDLRFGQVVASIHSQIGLERDMFNVEDDLTESILWGMIEKLK